MNIDTVWRIEIAPTRGEQLRVSRVGVCLGVEISRTSYLTAALGNMPRSKTRKTRWALAPVWSAPDDKPLEWPAVVAEAGCIPLGIIADDPGVLLEDVWAALRAERIASVKAAAQAKAAEVVALLEELDALQPRPPMEVPNSGGFNLLPVAVSSGAQTAEGGEA